MRGILKKLILCLFGVSLILVYSHEAKGIDWCNNISSFEFFKLVVKNKKCADTGLTLDEPLTANDNLLCDYSNMDTLRISKSIDADMSMMIYVDAEGKELVLNNIIFDKVQFVVYKGAPVLNNVDFVNFLYKPLAVLEDGQLECQNCDSESGEIYLWGQANFDGGSISAGKYRAFIIDSAKTILLKNLEFHSQEEKPYIDIELVKYLEIKDSTFKIGDKEVSAIKLNKVDGDQVVMVRNNKYVKEGSGSMKLSQIFDAADGTSTSTLGKLTAKYDGYDGTYYKIRIDTPVSDNTLAGETCPGPKVNDRLVNFEPYLLSYDKTDLKGVYPIPNYVYEEKDDKKYIKIKMDQKVEGEDLAGKRFSVLGLCEGFGITLFSDEDTFIRCADDEKWENGKCVKLPGCESDDDCSEDEECTDGVCKPIPKPECTTDEDCGPDQACQDEKCVAKPAPACESDADCDVGHYCETVEKICLACADAGEVDLVCLGGTPLIIEGEVKRCQDGRDPVCPANSEVLAACGNICACKPDYRAVARSLCVDELTSLVCLKDEILDVTTQTCIKPGAVPPARPGGCDCSLAR